MIKQVIYGTTGFICIIIGFFVVIPTWNLTGNAISGAGSSLITNPTYLGSFQSLGVYINGILGYSIIAMGVGVWVYFLLFAWRREVVTSQSPYEEN